MAVQQGFQAERQCSSKDVICKAAICTLYLKHYCNSSCANETYLQFMYFIFPIAALHQQVPAAPKDST